jgi:Na+-transporting methylmalonyl-CoA/oxaloacetate decarboxylase gamma subunit
MQFIPILAVAEKFSTSVMDALPHLAGMLMVLTTLTILWGVCALTAKLVHVLMPEQTAVAGAVPAAKTAATPRPAVAAGMPPEIVAVIAAAVATTTGDQPVRIVSIKPMSTSWEKAGRQSVLTSHRIR